jgi:hypothetical protein
MCVLSRAPPYGLLASEGGISAAEIRDVRVMHVPTTSQFADIFTNGLPTSVLSEFQFSLNIRSG